jgi:hypothetical protein
MQDPQEVIHTKYDRLYELASVENHPSYLLDITRNWRDGTWRM